MRCGSLVFCAAVLAFPAIALAQHATVGGVAVRVLSHQALVRSALNEVFSSERRVSQLGAELTLPTPWNALRVEGRVLRGERGRLDLRSIDAGFVAGWPVMGIAVGYAQRGSYDPETGSAHGRDVEFARAGVRVRFGEPDAYFILHLRSDAYVPIRAAADPADGLRGWDAEGGVTWRARHRPYTASLGYRLERFRIFRVDQEVSALTLAFGVAFGGR